MLHIQNPLSEDFVVMRTTLLPSLLQIASENREREKEIRLFEIANVYYQTDKGWKDLPIEELEVGAVFFGMKEPWRVAKGYVEHVIREMGIRDVSWKRLAHDTFWHPGRTVQAFVKGHLIATVGEVSPKIAGNFKLEGPVGLVHMPFSTMLTHIESAQTYQPVSTYPEAKRDIAVVVDHRVEYDDVARSIKGVDHCIQSVEWFDTYRGKNLPEGKKSLAMHITLSATDRTLESSEVEAVLEKVVLTLKETFKAELRG
jgi:phenylalanyl-tRNA synthetase beta chain